MLYVSGTDADEVCSLNKLKESSFLGAPDIPDIVMKGQVAQADGFQAEVEGTETEGITTLGFTMFTTFGIEMSSETLINAAEEEKIIWI